MRYARQVAADAPEGAVEATEEHVRAHLAAIADADDDPSTRAADVRVEVEWLPDGGGVLVVGELDGVPAAPYLADGYDPDAEERPGFVAWIPGEPVGDES